MLHLEVCVLHNDRLFVVRILQQVGSRNMISQNLHMARIDLLVGRQNEHLALQLSEEIFRDIVAMFCVNSCKRCINNKRNLMTTKLYQ